MRSPLTKCRALAETPDSVKIRIYETYGSFYVIVRDGEGWESVGCYKEKDDALQVILDYYDKKLRRWSFEVKVKAGWVCETVGCGELDRRLLESHHIKPKDLFPELMYELSNGKCPCIRCHAEAHKDNPEVAAMILERLKQVA